MMAKSKYETQHEEDMEKLVTLLKKYKEDYDLCDEGYNAFIEEANSKLSKPLPNPYDGKGFMNIRIHFTGGVTLEYGSSTGDFDLNVLSTIEGHLLDQGFKVDSVDYLSFDVE